MDRKIKLKALNPYITCNICKGYLIDATAITECLHTFCKSCLIKHLEANTNCPTCDMVIHHSYPRQYINFDRTMQDIVYKLVPGLQEREIQREREFYRQRGLPCPKEMLLLGEETKEKSPEPDYSEKEELINLCLECTFVNPVQTKHFFVRVPTKTTVLHLKKFIARSIFKDNDLENVVIFCSCEELALRDTMKYVYLTKWKFDDVPLLLRCQPKNI